MLFIYTTFYLLFLQNESVPVLKLCPVTVQIWHLPMPMHTIILQFSTATKDFTRESIAYVKICCEGTSFERVLNIY